MKNSATTSTASLIVFFFCDLKKHMWRLEIGNKMPIEGSRLVFKKCPELGFRVCRKGKGHTHTPMQTHRERRLTIDS
jgi:hypothetical protein